MEDKELCKECVDGICKLQFPTVKDFSWKGIFNHIKLPIPKNEKIPEEVIRYIYGKHYQDADKFDNYYIKKMLNELGDSLKYYESYPTLKDFKEGGKLSHVKLTWRDDYKIPYDVIKFIFGSKFEAVDDVPYEHRYEIRHLLIHFERLLRTGKLEIVSAFI